MTANVAASIRAPVSARDWFQRFYEGSPAYHWWLWVDC